MFDNFSALFLLFSLIEFSFSFIDILLTHLFSIYQSFIKVIDTVSIMCKVNKLIL